jgi:hypothetical protein
VVEFIETLAETDNGKDMVLLVTLEIVFLPKNILSTP